MKPESSLGELLDFAGLWATLLFLLVVVGVIS